MNETLQTLAHYTADDVRYPEGIAPIGVPRENSNASPTLTEVGRTKLDGSREEPSIVVIQAKAKLGGVLQETPKATGGQRGGRPRIDHSRRVLSITPTLAQVGLTKKTS